VHQVFFRLWGKSSNACESIFEEKNRPPLDIVFVVVFDIVFQHCSVFGLRAHSLQEECRGWDAGRWPFGLSRPKLQPTNPWNHPFFHHFIIFLNKALAIVSGPAPCPLCWLHLHLILSFDPMCRGLILLLLLIGGINPNPGPYTQIPNFDQLPNPSQATSNQGLRNSGIHLSG
jgi:hypothetical protein